MINYILGLFGLEIRNKKDFSRELEMATCCAQEKGFNQGLNHFKKRIENGIWHLRDLTHNLPGRLQLGGYEEEKFAAEALAYSWELMNEPGHHSHRFAVSTELEKELTGRCPMMSGPALDKSHFERARGGSIEDALYITKVIFSKYTEGKSPDEILNLCREKR